jgi:molybdopterin-containing oxidoreductase family membrane subunit
MNTRLLKPAFFAAGAALFVFGLYGWWERLVNGIEVVRFGSVVTWGLWVAVYIYFIGLSAGAFLVSSLVYVFKVKRFETIGPAALFTAVVTLLMALLVTWADIGHMERAWHVFAYPNFSSPMAWMLFLYTFYFLIVACELWLVNRVHMARGRREPSVRGRLYRVLTAFSKDESEESAQRDEKRVRVLATIGVPVAILFHGGVGALFGVVAARPGWNSGLFPILFLLSALVSGGALLVVVASVFQDGWTRNRETVLALGRLVLALLVVDVLFQVAEILVAAYSSVPSHVAPLKLIVGGPYWWVFWIWQIAIGTVVPIVLLSARTRRSAQWVAAAALLIAVGFIGVRLNIVIPVMATEEINGLSAAVDSARLTTHYSPSLSEWALGAGVLGLGLLLFGVGEYFLPRRFSSVEVDHVPA